MILGIALVAMKRKIEIAVDDFSGALTSLLNALGVMRLLKAWR